MSGDAKRTTRAAITEQRATLIRSLEDWFATATLIRSLEDSLAHETAAP